MWGIKVFGFLIIGIFLSGCNNDFSCESAIVRFEVDKYYKTAAKGYRFTLSHIVVESKSDNVLQCSADMEVGDGGGGTATFGKSSDVKYSVKKTTSGEIKVSDYSKKYEAFRWVGMDGWSPP